MSLNFRNSCFLPGFLFLFWRCRQPGGYIRGGVGGSCIDENCLESRGKRGGRFGRPWRGGGRGSDGGKHVIVTSTGAEHMMLNKC